MENIDISKLAKHIVGNTRLTDLEKLRFVQTKIGRPVLSRELKMLGIGKSSAKKLVRKGKLVKKYSYIKRGTFSDRPTLEKLYSVADLEDKMQ